MQVGAEPFSIATDRGAERASRMEGEPVVWGCRMVGVRRRLYASLLFQGDIIDGLESLAIRVGSDDRRSGWRDREIIFLTWEERCQSFHVGFPCDPMIPLPSQPTVICVVRKLRETLRDYSKTLKICTMRVTVVSSEASRNLFLESGSE